MGLLSWLGFERCLGCCLVDTFERPGVALTHTFPGLGREFMPPLMKAPFLHAHDHAPCLYR